MEERAAARQVTNASQGHLLLSPARRGARLPIPHGLARAEVNRQLRRWKCARAPSAGSGEVQPAIFPTLGVFGGLPAEDYVDARQDLLETLRRQLPNPAAE